MTSGPREPAFKDNQDVRLHAESNDSARQPYEILHATIVRWVQCHPCRQRFWYALAADTPREELWWWGAQFRRLLAEQGCQAHPTD
ncbi:MAG TPA: hypothetical protein VM536_17465 [Chloroflexia bacterium]|nr:hypothetical protein [Chloroflexia bacterium]